MSQFRKPSQKPRDEPEGLDRFAAGAAVTPVVHLIERTTVERAISPDPDPEICGLNVRFTREQKRALEAIARHEDRSQQKVISRLLGPLLVARARELEVQSGP